MGVAVAKHEKFVLAGNLPVVFCWVSRSNTQLVASKGRSGPTRLNNLARFDKWIPASWVMPPGAGAAQQQHIVRKEILILRNAR